jgi:hypothetical protein
VLLQEDTKIIVCHFKKLINDSISSFSECLIFLKNNTLAEHPETTMTYFVKVCSLMMNILEFENLEFPKYCAEALDLISNTTFLQFLAEVRTSANCRFICSLTPRAASPSTSRTCSASGS